MNLGTETEDGHTMLQRLIPYTKARQLKANLHVVPPGGGSAGVLSHEGKEVGFVVEGYIEITVKNERHLCGPWWFILFSLGIAAPLSQCGHHNGPHRVGQLPALLTGQSGC